MLLIIFHYMIFSSCLLFLITIGVLLYSIKLLNTAKDSTTFAKLIQKEGLGSGLVQLV